jgi:hypothetical protein
MMNEFELQFGRQKSARARRLKEAVVACFHASPAEVAARFQSYSEADWREILFWLDISGMALYLLDQVRAEGIERCLPPLLRNRLQLNLEQNRLRTAQMLCHADDVGSAFRRHGIDFALIKGITLASDSVPEPALRWQTDLDFLISGRDADTATTVLEELGYEPHATSGGTIEFRSGLMGKPDLANLYRPGTQRSLELHCLRRTDREQDRLARARSKSFPGGIELPALSSADILVQQALHLLKHLCGEHTRLSWVLEFWRHIRVRQNDRQFWGEVKAIAATEPKADLALSISVWLATSLFGKVSHGAIEIWGADGIPDGVKLWLRRYSRELLLSDSIATKLYLILRRQLPREGNSKGTARLILPLCLPAKITQSAPGETLAARLSRYRIEGNYSLRRLRFHLCEGIRYGVEALRWELVVPRVQRP